MLNLIRSDLTDRACPIRVNQGVVVVVADGHGLIDGWKLQLNFVVRGKRGTDLQGFGHSRKPGLRNLEPINAVGEALYVQAALIVGRQCVAIVVRLTSDMNGRFYAQTRRIGHFQTQFATIALAEERQGKQKEKGYKSLHAISVRAYRQRTFSKGVTLLYGRGYQGPKNRRQYCRNGTGSHPPKCEGEERSGTCSERELLRILFDGSDALAGEFHEDRFVRRMAVNPVFGVVAAGVALANLAVGLAHSRHHFVLIHSQDRVTLRNSFFLLRRKRVNPMNRGRMLLRKVQEGREELLQLLGGHVRNRLRELQDQRSTRAGLQPWRALILSGGRSWLINRIGNTPHTDGYAIAPVLLGASAAVQIHDNRTIVKIELGNLHAVAGIHGRTVIHHGALQHRFIHRLVDVKDKPFFTTGHRLAGLGVLAGDEAYQVEFGSLLQRAVFWSRRCTSLRLRIGSDEHRKEPNAFAGRKRIGRGGLNQAVRRKLRQVRISEHHQRGRNEKPVKHRISLEPLGSPSPIL